MLKPIKNIAQQNHIPVLGPSYTHLEHSACIQSSSDPVSNIFSEIAFLDYDKSLYYFVKDNEQ